MDVGKFLFRSRGYTPIPFMLILILQSDLQLWSMFIGGVFAATGEWIRLNGVRAAGGRTRTRNVGAKELCTWGFFSYVRNPLYLGNILIYTGMTLFAGGEWLAQLLVFGIAFFIIQYALIISLEEETLRGIFGNAYREYCANVPRLFPRSKPWKKDQDIKFLTWEKVLKTERTTLMVFGAFLLAVILKHFLFA